MKKYKFVLCCAALSLTLATPLYSAERQPYAGQEARAIKALSEQELFDLAAGRGMGLAKAAELNHYPGPLHVQEHAKALGLTEAQRSATESISARMRSSAQELGRQIIDAEKKLDSLFAQGVAEPVSVREVVNTIARLHGELRYAHLAAHLEMRRLLTPQQIAHYDSLRGYGASGHVHGHHQH
jgi:Spy/CpxP family protein refolding chaperone